MSKRRPERRPVGPVRPRSQQPTGIIKKSGRVITNWSDYEWTIYEGYLDNVIWIRQITKLDLDDIWV